VEPLVLAVDRQQLGGRTRDPHHVPRPVGLDQVVPVRQAAGELGDHRVLPAPQRDPLDDLLDRRPLSHHAAVCPFAGSNCTVAPTSAGTRSPNTSTSTASSISISTGRYA